jgi:prepilin-type N-terminal cleavage/methylation domain-containing protein
MRIPTENISDDRGFTLIELVIATTMALVVVAGAMSMLVFALKNQPKVSEGADQVAKARAVSERMAQELRQGVKIETREASKVVFLTYVHTTACTTAASTSAGAIQCRVTYTCATTGTCTRSVLNADGSGTALTSTLVTGVSNPTEVFCYMPSTEAGKCGAAKSTEASTYVGIKLQLPAAGKSAAVTLENGATLHNATLAY